jgi:hypothetical protein
VTMSDNRKATGMSDNRRRAGGAFGCKHWCNRPPRQFVCGKRLLHAVPSYHFPAPTVVSFSLPACTQPVLPTCLPPAHYHQYTLG